MSFSGLLEQVERWAGKVREYEGTPDLWAELRRTSEFLASGQDRTSENTPFTPAEQKQISNQLREIKASLKDNSELRAEQLSQIEERLDEAEEASHRLGRKDWVLLFTGTVFTLIITGTVTPDVAQHILMAVFHGLGHLFIGGMKPISGPHTK